MNDELITSESYLDELVTFKSKIELRSYVCETYLEQISYLGVLSWTNLFNEVRETAY